MRTRQLRDIIENGEGDTVEFKRKFTEYEKMAREMIALANTRGGYLVVGVDDDGSIVGVQSEKSEMELLDTTANGFCEPPVEMEMHVVPIDGVDVIVLEIPESRTKPHALMIAGAPAPDTRDGRVYIRQGEKSVVASREVARVLAATSADAPPLRLEIGNIERAIFDFLETNRRITLRQVRQLLNISERRASRTLVRLVRAGMLRIFTNEGEDYFTLG